MPIIVLIGTASRFKDDLVAHFTNKIEICVMESDFKASRSALASNKDEILYILPHLSKPERYEIFCLARKNSQNFLSLADKENDESCTSDKNVCIIQSFNGNEIEEKLQSLKIAPTTANRRSKGVSLKSISELKSMIVKVNAEYKDIEGISLILQECEDRVVKIWNFNPKYTLEEAEQCYRLLVETEIKKK